MSAAGYSGTPLAKKLGFKEGMRAVYVDAPEGFSIAGVTTRARLAKSTDLVLCFVKARRDLERRLPALRRSIEPAGMLWIAWPKRASKVATDITEDVVREVALPTGLVDTKVCAIDEVWSGLRLVVRRELR
ncbi:MAG: hypothetical protein QOH62_52 [Solirubrobacteraceae bacterium]|nr:hypothetical protein [Solirubrobacteraceae bacterium]